MSELRDLKIEGMGSCYGGVYNRVKLEGMSTIKDNLKCNSFSSEGMCKCEGQIEAEDMNIEGTFKGIGSIRAKKFNAEGYIKVKNCPINADEISLEGFMTCGELSADIIDIDGVCHAEKIFGESIKINPSINIKSVFNLFFKSSNISKAELIECTELKANALTANIIRASRVELGKDCEVNVVEYSEIADIHPNAKVKNLTKI